MDDTLASLTPERLAAQNEGGYIVLKNLLDDTDMAAPKGAMTEMVNEIANNVDRIKRETDHRRE